MTNRRVVVTQRFFDEDTADLLRASGCTVEVIDLPAGKGDGDLDQDELAAALRGAAGWIVGHARVSAELLATLPSLQVISRRGVGYERVDTQAVINAGKVACIAVGGNHDSVADYTLALMLAVGHRFREMQADLADGRWKIQQGSDLYQKTVGIIGLGRIGSAVARRLAGFDCRVLGLSGSSPVPPPVEQADLGTILRESDYITLHAPLTPQTRHLIGRDSLSRMKRDAVVINTARGGLIDDTALLHALESGIIAGAGLDTFESESDPALAPVTRQLAALPQVVAAPHAGASTREGLVRTNRIAAQCVIAVLDGRYPPAECVIADGRRQAQ